MHCADIRKEQRREYTVEYENIALPNAAAKTTTNNKYNKPQTTTTTR